MQHPLSTTTKRMATTIQLASLLGLPAKVRGAAQALGPAARKAVSRLRSASPTHHMGETTKPFATLLEPADPSVQEQIDAAVRSAVTAAVKAERERFAAAVAQALAAERPIADLSVLASAAAQGADVSTLSVSLAQWRDISPKAALRRF